MRIEGEWVVCEDGMPRPAVRVRVVGADGQAQGEYFQVDALADRTVFSAHFLSQLRLPVRSPSPGIGLQGIGGRSSFVLLTAALELTRDGGEVVRVKGEFAGFTDPDATDLSILGRDVLNIFDVIVSRRRNEVLLLAPNHHYQVVQA
jgi:hypothetical protein